MSLYRNKGQHHIFISQWVYVVNFHFFLFARLNDNYTDARNHEVQHLKKFIECALSKAIHMVLSCVLKKCSYFLLFTDFQMLREDIRWDEKMNRGWDNKRDNTNRWIKEFKWFVLSIVNPPCINNPFYFYFFCFTSYDISVNKKLWRKYFFE